MIKGNILIVDDDKNVLEVLSLRLETEGYQVAVAADAETALKLAKDNLFDLALVDLKLSGKENGIELMEKIHQAVPEIPVIILTAYGTIDTAVEAMKRGAYSFVTKPFNRRELLLQIKNGLEKSGLSREVRRLKALVGEKYGLENIIGKSKQMQQVMDQVARAAETDSNVCVYGESGTGKELVAKSLHLLSLRKNEPFVPVNCSAIPESLHEGELFGYEKGAFTGAVKSKKGFFAQAHKGTIFLDEISEMPESMQAKLLRVIQEKQFYPLGKEQPVNVDVRILTATNKNLKEAVARGNFREDLFYRIFVIPITLPPLRDRKEDIPLLVDHFIKKYNREMKKSIKGFTESALGKLMDYSWPGNVRELENTIEYAVAMTTQEMVGKDLILQADEMENSDPKSLKDAKNQFEKSYISNLLSVTGGNVSKASKLAGKYRSDFYDLLKKHDLDPSDFKR
jgi:two-component system, NtrC family, response regulator GlrR